MLTQHNVSLRKAVAAALGVVALGTYNNCLALGLGDIVVKSHIGEPLRASIKVLGASELKNTACFSLGSKGDDYLTNANLDLAKIAGDNAILTIATSEVVNEPILNLSIVADCETLVQRDYVVLVNPRIVEDADTIVNNSTAIEVDNQDIVPIKKVAEKQARKNVKVSTNKLNTHKNKPTSNFAANENNPNIVLHVPSGSPRSEKESTESKPNLARLSISGGTHANSSGLSGLRLDHQLTFTPNSNSIAVTENSDADLADDITAMHNRLAHLQLQLSELQNNNQVLRAQLQHKTAETASFGNQMKSIGLGLGGIFLLLSGRLGAQWWRRRSENQSLDDIFTPLEMAKKVEVAQEDEDIFDLMPNAQSFMVSTQETLEDSQAIAELAETGQSYAVVEENGEQTVLDHADVFLSHGRTRLAIQFLQNHLIEHGKESVTVWLFLLDLLAKENMQAVYEQTASECKALFNIHIPGFDHDDTQFDGSLESYPRLSQGLQQVWGTPSAIAYLDDLIYNNRLEPRHGFSKELIDELLMLKSLAQHQHGNVAEIIQLDEKKQAIIEQKEAQIASQKAQQLERLHALEKAEIEAKQSEDAMVKKEKNQTDFEFGLVEWN